MRHGVLLVDMNFSGIEQLFRDVSLGGDGYVYLVDSYGEIIYHPRRQLLYSNLITENNLRAVHYDDGSHIERFNGESRMLTVKTVGYTGWKIIGVTPMRSITSDFYRIHSKGSGIGLRNVHERIQLCYGEEYGLTILSQPDHGTTVRVQLPQIGFDTVLVQGGSNV